MLVALSAVAVPAEMTPADTASSSLAACIREALDANPGLGAATAHADAAAAAAVAVAAGRWPRLDLSAGYLYSERAQRLAQPSSPGELLRYDHDIAEAAVEMRVPLYAGGRLLAGARAADLAAAASRMARDGTRQDIALDVAAAYLAAVEQRASVNAVQGALDALEAQSAMASTLEEVGRIAPLDRLKVEVRAAAVRQQLSRARRDRELILHHLAALLGRGPTRPTPEVGKAPAPLPVAASAEQLVAEALESRPELKAARHEVDRSEQELAIVIGERLPAVDAYARYTARSVIPLGGDDPPGHYQYGAGGLSIRLPLWTGGEIKARAVEARARVAEAQERARAIELRVTEEVRMVLAAHAEAGERQVVASRALDQAREAFDIERVNYELGRSAVNDVLDAQAALLEAELADAQAGHDLALASMAVARATGRDVVALLLAGEGEER